MSVENILIIGASGQIGSELTLALRKSYGDDHVFATDVKQPSKDILESGPFQILDVLDNMRLVHFVIRHKITQVYHLAAVLSGNAEKIPLHAWEINMKSLLSVLDMAKEVEDIRKVFWPSSIAVFGSTTPKNDTPQTTIMEPTTVYGISKLAGERWCSYYHKRYGLDVRSVRYPGLISYKTEAGGGTTDYAVEIYYDAVCKGHYDCFLNENTRLPMMFMDDAIKATAELMEIDSSKLSYNSSLNLSAMSFTPKEVAEEIKKHIPNFTIDYKPDFRQAIADTWPESLDDSYSRVNEGWTPEYNLSKTTETMITQIKRKYNL